MSTTVGTGGGIDALSLISDELSGGGSDDQLVKEYEAKIASGEVELSDLLASIDLDDSADYDTSDPDAEAKKLEEERLEKERIAQELYNKQVEELNEAEKKAVDAAYEKQQEEKEAQEAVAEKELIETTSKELFNKSSGDLDEREKQILAEVLKEASGDDGKFTQEEFEAFQAGKAKAVGDDGVLDEKEAFALKNTLNKIRGEDGEVSAEEAAQVGDVFDGEVATLNQLFDDIAMETFGEKFDDLDDTQKAQIEQLVIEVAGPDGQLDDAEREKLIMALEKAKTANENDGVTGDKVTLDDIRSELTKLDSGTGDSNSDSNNQDNPDANDEESKTS